MESAEILHGAFRVKLDEEEMSRVIDIQATTWKEIDEWDEDSLDPHGDGEWIRTTSRIVKPDVLAFDKDELISICSDYLDSETPIEHSMCNLRKTFTYEGDNTFVIVVHEGSEDDD